MWLGFGNIFPVGFYWHASRSFIFFFFLPQNSDVSFPAKFQNKAQTKYKSLHSWTFKINHPLFFFGLDTCFHSRTEPDWNEMGAKQSVIRLQAAQTALEKPTLHCEMAEGECVSLCAYQGMPPSHNGSFRTNFLSIGDQNPTLYSPGTTQTCQPPKTT